MSITKLIEFNGKTFETKFYREVSDEEFEQIRREHYRLKKSKSSSLRLQMGNVQTGW